MTKKIIPFEISLKSTKRAGFTFQPRPQILTNDANAAELNFIITDTSAEELTGATATVLLFMKDGSFFQNTDVTRVNNAFVYTIKPNQAKHKGVAQVQLVVKIGSVENASPLMEVDIVGGLESKPIVEREIQDWTSLTAEAKAFVEQIEGFTLESFVENKMGEELANLEGNYATRLTGLEQKDNQITAQLAQTNSRISEIITTPVDGTITQQEIINARQGHTSLGDNFQTVKNNVTNIDKRTVIPMINHIENGNFADGTSQWSGVDRSSISVVNNTLISKAYGYYNVGWAQQSPFSIPFTIGRKIFIKARVRVTNEHATEIAAIFTNDNGEYDISTSKIKNPSINKWYTIQEIISVNSGVESDTSLIRFEHKYPDKNIASGKEMEVQYVMTVDLTADFKLLPSEVEVLGILDKYPNGWFDKVGTQKTVDDIYDIILKQNDVYLENEIQNGDFTNGTIGWVSHSTFDMQAENGELVVTANVDGTALDLVNTHSNVTQGDEYYVSFEINPFRTHSARFLLGGVTVYADSDLPAGEFSKVSGTVTTIDNTVLHMYSNGRESTGVVEGVQTIFRKPIVINISKNFGVGNEPTKEYMDNLIERLGWFDNRKVLSNSDLMFLMKPTGAGGLDDVLTYENEPWEEI